MAGRKVVPPLAFWRNQHVELSKVRLPLPTGLRLWGQNRRGWERGGRTEPSWPFRRGLQKGLQWAQVGWG